MSEMTFAERVKSLSEFFTSGAANALRDGYRDAIGSAYQLASELVKAGLGKRRFYEKEITWLMAAAIEELDIPQVALKGKFRGWRVANGQIYTVDELYGIRKLFRNGEQVYEGELLKWFLDEEGHWYVERYVDSNDPKKGCQILCDGNVAFEGFYDEPRASEGHLYIPLDGETTREDVEFLSIYKDGDRSKLVYRGRVDSWHVSKDRIFVFSRESGKTVLQRDGDRVVLDTAKWSEVGPLDFQVRNGFAFVMGPKILGPYLSLAWGIYTFVPAGMNEILENKAIIRWRASVNEDRVSIFGELRDKKTGMLEIWKWPEHVHSVWTYPMADYQVDGRDVYVRIFQADGQSVILKLENP